MSVFFPACPVRRAWRGYFLERAAKRQMGCWSNTAGVTVCSRPLDYFETIRGRKKRWVGREKGIDVMLAVDIVDMARTDAYDTAVVFSADTDYLKSP